MKRMCHIFVSTAVVFFITLQSCESYLDRKPLFGPSDEDYFNNADELSLAVSGLYSAMTYHASDGIPVNLTQDAISDLGWDRNTSPLQSLGRGDHDSNNDYVINIWREAYKVIGKCNFILDNMHKLEGEMDMALYERYQAETRFVRAFTYQYLADFFGGVPLAKSRLTLDSALIPKAPQEEVVDFVLQELYEAAEMLPESYGAADIGRATKGAALAIRARAALNNGRWSEAIKSTKAVMDMEIYSLHPNFGELFSYAGQSSQEIIFAFQYLRDQGTRTHVAPRAFLSRNAQGHSNKIPSQALIDLYTCTDGLEIDESQLYDPEKPFENRDPRLGYTVALPGTEFFGFQFETHKDSTQCWNYAYNTSVPVRIGNQEATNAYATFSGYCWKKYVDFEDKDFVANSELNIIQSRYAEVLLIYAEAKIEAGEIDQSVYDALNQVRQRSSVEMPPIALDKTQAELRELVRKERAYELANEGFRMVDLRRWELAEKIMNGTVYGRIPRGLLATAPKIDIDGFVDYSAVPNRGEMRVIENRKFNAQRDYLWPIPNIETVTNPNLEQNPNY
ncbi:RagB/SusD family nutrient uptake outer membrane protein [Sphingobacterium haloxyli]|uniref:RagB/SusD family nutrient uptake outer membrane protein n=1 Tax=Sphingobacterium haloxyli TaxID=2100533 RepID=A0A2S9J3T6_9SPHI|nr:RagB/SusD family nutrient uptake outer membrane protein [Sphingobacterium haloxyli]PRD47447.1 hypothetical protein C5745_08975 [Sphingobacterium haloxyli]